MGQSVAGDNEGNWIKNIHPNWIELMPINKDISLQFWCKKEYKLMSTKEQLNIQQSSDSDGREQTILYQIFSGFE